MTTGAVLAHRSDALSLDESDGAAGPGDDSAVPICVSDDCGTAINSDQIMSDEDLPAAACEGDQRQVIRIRDVQIVDLPQNGRSCNTRRAVWGAKHPMDITGGSSQLSTCVQALPPEVQTSDIPPGAGATNLTPVV